MCVQSVAFFVFGHAIPFADESAKLLDILLLLSLDFSPFLNMHLLRTLTYSTTCLVPFLLHRRKNLLQN